MPGTKRKTKSTKKNTESASKKPLKPLKKTTDSSSSTTSNTRAKTKTVSKSSRGTRESESSSSSSRNKSGVELDSSQRAALQKLKKKSIAARSKTGSGWIRPTSEEREALKDVVEKMKRGRPPKEVRREVVSIRLTADEAARIRKAAMKAKVPWTEFIRKGALDACDHV